jgi:hypothetical protein
MAGASRRLAIAAVSAALLAGALAPAPSRAADEPGPVILPGDTWSAVPFDLDADGIEEVVRIVSDGSARAVEAWRFDASSGWQRAVRLPATAAVAGLVPIVVDGRPTLLVAGVVGTPTDGGGRCCLRLHELGGTLADGLSLAPLPLPELLAESVLVADLDDDGTDELVLSGYDFAEDGMATGHLTILGVSSGAWSPTHATTWEGGFSLLAGNTDGLGGTDLLLDVGGRGRLHRITLGDDGFATEAARLPGAPDGDAPFWVAGIADGRLVAVRETGISAIRWPAGGVPVTEAELQTERFPYVVPFPDAAGPDLLIAETDPTGAPGEGEMVVYGSDLRVVAQPPGDVRWSRAIARFNELFRNVGFLRPISPWTGPIPGGWRDGRPAFVGFGRLLLAGQDGELAERPFPFLTGHALGLAGPDRDWLVACGACPAALWGDQVYLGEQYTESELRLVPLADLERGVNRPPTITATYVRAAEIGADGDVVRLLSHVDGGAIAVVAPAGTIVMSVQDGTTEDHGPITEAIQIPIEAPASPEADDEFQVDVLAIGPDGVLEMRRFEGSFAVTGPPISVRAEGNGLFRSTVIGRTSPGSSVTVDGQPVAVSRFGGFRADVGAPPWPHLVEIEVLDPLGIVATDHVEVLGVVDYRGWPWAVIFGILTLGIGAALFLRTPARRARVTAAPGDGELEEIDEGWQPADLSGGGASRR